MSSDAVAVPSQDSAVLEVDEVIRTGAIEQARWRLGQLHQSFSSTMVILADMHQDEDWRYLTDPEGSPYQSFTAMLAAELEISDSWARRQQQGLVDLVLPLRQLTLPETRIPVSGGDVAALGKRGAEYVREHAAQALSGITEPRAQEKALRALLDDTRARINGDPPSSPARPEGHVIDAGQDEIYGSDPQDLPPRTVDDSDLIWDEPSTEAPSFGEEPRGGSTEEDDRPADDLPARAGTDTQGPAVSRGDSTPGGGGGGGTSRYGTARASAAQDHGDDTGPGDERGQDDEEFVVASLAGVADGDEAWEASLKVLATATVPADPDVDVETMTAAMLKISQLRSKLMAKNRPSK